MSSSSIDPGASTTLTGFVGDIGGAHGGAGIFRASSGGIGADLVLGVLVRASAAIVLLMLAALLIVLTAASLPSIRAFGGKFLTVSAWRPNEREVTKRDAKGNIVRDADGEPVTEIIPPAFGALPVIYGTAVSSALAMLFAVPVSLGAALFLVRIGPWLTPTFVKCGMLGMVVTTFMLLRFGHGGASVCAALAAGIIFTCAVMWIAWQIEDPRRGTRWEIEIPILTASWLFGSLLIHVVGDADAMASAVGGSVVSGLIYFLAPGAVAIISFLIEFLAAIPSIAYGIWGLFVVAPFLQNHLESPLNSFFGWVPFLRFLHTDGFPSGRDMFCAGLILAIMILPIITSISRDVLRAVPRIQIEGTQALGATWWQSSWAMLRYGRSGLFGAGMLGLARAAGETMAVAMVIGNDPHIHSSIFEPAQTMSSLLANEFAEASTDLHRAALIEVALILLVMSLTFNVVARYLVVGTQARPGG